MSKLTLTDFNDLAVHGSIEAVTKQIAHAITHPQVIKQAANDEAVDNPTAPVTPELAPVSSPMPSPMAGDDYKLQDMLKRYRQIMDTGKATNKVYDLTDKIEYTKTQFAYKIGNKKLADKWWQSDHKTIQRSEVNRALGEMVALQSKSMFDRYVLIYGTKEVWDEVESTRMPIDTLKLARPNEYDMWLKSEHRRIVKPQNLVFDPTYSLSSTSEKDDEGNTIEVINTFGGLPTKPLDIGHDEARAKAKPIIDLVHHLCENNPTITQWVLNWLAIPIQTPGTKMDTALIFHGEVQGAGKSLFFGRIMRQIYGDYALTLGQGQLESQYNDWVAGKLYVLFEEIFSGKDRYAHMGMIKQLITGDTVYVNKKFVSGWTEANYVNAVFLSNNMMPLSLEKNDRRHVVCYPQQKIPKPLLNEIEQALKDPNHTMIRAFYTFLKTLHTGKQHAHTEALYTDSKDKLIRLSQPSWEGFYEDWRHGNTFVPYKSCLSKDLYYAYVMWCKGNGERATSSTKFLTYIGRHEKKDRFHYTEAVRDKKQATIVAVNMPTQFPTGTTQQDWLGKQIKEFKLAITREDDSG